MTFDDYVKLPAINWSTLKEMRRSPKHYRHCIAEPREETSAMLIGRAVHTAVLEPDRFLLDYVLWKGARRAGKEWEAFEAAHTDKTILRADEYLHCLAVKEAVRAHPLARHLLECGEAEKTVTWTDPETGLPCKGRIDWLNGIGICDLKTTADLDPQRFGATAARMGHHCQMAFYRQGYAAMTGEMVPIKILAVEQNAPHDVAVFTLDEDALAAGEDEVAGLLRHVAECRSTDKWPGRYGDGEQPLPLPAWAFSAMFDDDTGALDGLGLVIGGADAA